MRACSSPPFFLLLLVFPWIAGRKVAAWGVSVLCLLRELGSVVDCGCEVACEW